ncbi:type II toxin-antitoxin system VapC family toxin [Okeania sp. SIO1I7]|uniref:type II toxin-antitoxin system VapC family toxin n=1 Tax=Okeania sp. SIO1I7 TaxID=2607772 RepID=UPI0013F9DAD6|nr:PIN domain-containing protein [Okeania sp. SIO1I7]NET26100.1 PIN domain-containing protein [Okeania sp. SIO1I7]
MVLQRNIPIADTGFVVALMNQKDIRHLEVAEIYRQQQQILLPQTVLAEVAYLVGREVGTIMVSTSLRYLLNSRFMILALTPEDLLRVAEILEIYQDSRIDFVDASVMAIAERLEITKVLTLDRRDFQLFRPKHCQFFEIMP